jgi:hypothetical protein
MADMRHARWKDIGLLLLGPVAAAALWVYSGVEWPSDTDVSAAQLSSASSTQRPLLRSTDAEDDFAWKEFEALTHASDSSVNRVDPEWKSWLTRCESGLKLFCDDEHFALQTINVHSPVLSPEIRALDIPTQTLATSQLHDSGEGTFSASNPDIPELSSILFNPLASQALKQAQLGEESILKLAVEHADREHKTGIERALREETFPAGSTIVKLIWYVIPSNQNEGVPVKLYSLKDAKVDTSAKVPETLNKIRDWKSRYFVYQENGSVKCPDLTLSKDASTRIPASCFYHFSIPASSPHDSKNKDIVQPKAGMQQPAVALLVGFHVMTLTAGNPNWMWMTFYWTPETTSDAGWRSPWDHYQMKSTAAIREEEKQEHRYCFNPYLEGTNPRGLHANCLSCHRLAAYSSSPSQDPTFAQGNNVLAPEEYESAAQRRKEQVEYFQHSVQTQFIWSIADNQSTSLPAHAEVVRKQTLDQFDNLLKLNTRDK